MADIDQQHSVTAALDARIHAGELSADEGQMAVASDLDTLLDHLSAPRRVAGWRASPRAATRLPGYTSMGVSAAARRC